MHPFEDPLVMRGQGTAALELHDQVGQLDALLVPDVGRRTDGRVRLGHAPARSRVRATGRRAGSRRRHPPVVRRGPPVRIAQPTTIADGLAVTAPGVATFAINSRLVSDVVTVTDDQLIGAMRIARDLLGRRLEPSGVGRAGRCARRAWLGSASRRVGIILSGGNIDDERFDALVPD